MNSLLSFVLKTDAVNCGGDVNHQISVEMTKENCKEKLKAVISKNGDEVTISSASDPEINRFAVLTMAICVENKTGWFSKGTPICSNVIDFGKGIPGNSFDLVRKLSNVWIGDALISLKSATDVDFVLDSGLDKTVLESNIEENVKFFESISLPIGDGALTWTKIFDALKKDDKKAKLFGIGNKGVDASSMSFKESFTLYMSFFSGIKFNNIEGLTSLFTFNKDSTDFTLKAGTKFYFACQTKSYNYEKFTKSKDDYCSYNNGFDLLRTGWLQISADGKKFEEVTKFWYNSWWFAYICVGFIIIIIGVAIWIVIKKSEFFKFNPRLDVGGEPKPDSSVIVRTTRAKI